MKKITSLLICCFAYCSVAQTIPVDYEFKQFLISQYYDTNNNGNIELSEVNTKTELNVNSQYLSSLQGIQYFTSLEVLDCQYNCFNSLDVSMLSNLRVLKCGGNNSSLGNCGLNFTSLNVSGLTNLEQLEIGHASLNNLNLTGLINLETLRCRNNIITSLNLDTLVNLKTLDCDSNEITTLEVSNCTQLEYLSCDYNNISNLVVNGLSNLNYLSCTNNGMQSIELTGLVSLLNFYCFANNLTTINTNDLIALQGFYCNSNQISSLDLQNQLNLKILTAYGNQLTNLNLSNTILLEEIMIENNQINELFVNHLVNLEKLFVGANPLSSLVVDNLHNLTALRVDLTFLTALDLSNLNQLQTLSISYTNIVSIDLSSLDFILSFICNNCPYLNYINVKNGSNESLSNFSNCPNLNFICADAGQVNSIQNTINNYGYTNCSVSSYCSFVPGGDFYTVEGNNKYDNDANGCDNEDVSNQNLKLNISSSSFNYNSVYCTNGEYSLPLQAGNVTITPILENPTYFNITPVSVSLTFPGSLNPNYQNFCITPNGIHNDLEVTIVPMNNAAPGFNEVYKIIYKNKGNTTLSGYIEFSYNDSVIDLVTSIPNYQSSTPNNISWNYSNLNPFEIREIMITLNLNAPTENPPLNLGDSLLYSVIIYPIAEDDYPSDNRSDLVQIVANSFDPNDKTCLEGATITPDKVGEYVHYMIRFENTGTANAQNIVVKDIIDTTKFDIATLVPLDGSHSFVTRISNSNQVEFIFENIQLPFDDANNDGYVAFKIKTKPTLATGSSFSNSASIYFDYNFPIVTNTATTTIQALGNQDFEFSNYFELAPNPAKNVLNIHTKNEIELSSISIYNTLGQLVLVIPNAKETASIDVSKLTSGTYFVKVISDKGSSNSKFIKE